MRVRAWILLACLLAGATHAGDDEIQKLLGELRTWPEKADDAFARLQAIGPTGFPEVLAALLDDPADALKARLVRLLAGYATQMESTESHIVDLRRVLAKKDPEVLDALVPAFAKAGPSILPSLERLLAASDSRTRSAVARALGGVGAAAFPEIRKNLGSASAFRCEAALLALAAAGEPAGEFSGEVKLLLADKRPAVRAAAALAYCALAADKGNALRAITPLLGDPEPSVRASAIEALTPLASSRLSELAALLAVAKGDARASLLHVLGSLPANSVQAYEDSLLASEPATRAALLEAHPLAVVPALSVAARKQIASWGRQADAATRTAALDVLSLVEWKDDPESFSILEAAARAEDPAVRAVAMFCLSRFDGSEAILRGALAEPDAVVRMEAACALRWKELPGPDPVPLCVELIGRVPLASERLAQLGPAALVAIDALLRTTKLPTCGASARRAMETLLLQSPPADALLQRAAMAAKAPAVLRASWEKALAWLARAQEKDGHWDGVLWGAARGCDIGLTGLALLAFLGAGETDASGAHADAVRRAAEYLVSRQKNGWIGDPGSRTFLLQHGIATAALAEAYCVCRDRNGAALALALMRIREARTPRDGWGYELRGPRDDPFTTTWMVQALKAGEAAGFDVDPEVYDGALVRIDNMTGPLFGEVGYGDPGGKCASPKDLGSTESVNPSEALGPPPPSPTFGHSVTTRYDQAKAARPYLARTSGCCTAAGLWIRRLLAPGKMHELETKATEVLVDTPPTWDPDKWSVDECYWHWGALAGSQIPPLNATKFGTKWRVPLEQMLLAHQDEDGSWEPVGVWGRTGGRVFSTAMASLALLAPYAYPEGCFSKDYRRKLYPEAYGVLGR